MLPSLICRRSIAILLAILAFPAFAEAGCGDYVFVRGVRDGGMSHGSRTAFSTLEFTGHRDESASAAHRSQQPSGGPCHGLNCGGGVPQQPAPLVTVPVERGACHREFETPRGESSCDVVMLDSAPPQEGSLLGVLRPPRGL